MPPTLFHLLHNRFINIEKAAHCEEDNADQQQDPIGVKPVIQPLSDDDASKNRYDHEDAQLA